MLRTFIEGFQPEGFRDELRDPLPTVAEVQEQRESEQERFQLNLLVEIKQIIAERRQKGLPAKVSEDIEFELRARFQSKQRSARRGERLGDRLLSSTKLRFKKWVRSIHVEDMMASIATMFYACDYSTKPSFWSVYNQLPGVSLQLPEDLARYSRFRLMSVCLHLQLYKTHFQNH